MMQGYQLKAIGGIIMEERKHCNEANCTCPKTTCPRHGTCCECIMNHRGNGSLVFCMREIANKQK